LEEAKKGTYVFTEEDSVFAGGEGGVERNGSAENEGPAERANESS